MGVYFRRRHRAKAIVIQVLAKESVRAGLVTVRSLREIMMRIYLRRRNGSCSRDKVHSPVRFLVPTSKTGVPSIPSAMSL